jgi:Domain of unknown function (DUF4824)
MTWSRIHTLIAGVALIAVTNAVALIGVAHNRGGEPESELRLTQRELAPPYWRGIDRESGGIELRLQWRALMKGNYDFYMQAGGQPEWLDRAKLAALGFDLTPPENTAAGRRYYERLNSRQVFVALELDGPAYQEALQRAQRRVDEAAATKPAPASGPMSPAERLRREQNSASRLFAIDAGPDPAALREKYPDRNRYAIVRARVRVTYFGGSAIRDAELTGHLSEVINDHISVPPEFRVTFDTLPRTSTYNSQDGPVSRFDVTLAFGKRFEPWIIAASAAK